MSIYGERGYTLLENILGREETPVHLFIIEFSSFPTQSFQNRCPWVSQDMAFLVNPFPNKPWFLRVYSTSLLIIPWEKEKLLVLSNFSFSHSVFCRFGKLLSFSSSLNLSSANSSNLKESKICRLGKG